MRHLSGLCVVALLVFVSPANARDYRAEIDLYVIDPCMEHFARSSDLLDQMSVTDAIALMKVMTSAEIENTYQQVTIAVTGKSAEDRKAIYEFGRMMCISAGEQ